MHKAVHLRNDSDRLYASREEEEGEGGGGGGGGGGGELTSIEDNVDVSIQRFEVYIEKSKKDLL